MIFFDLDLYLLLLLLLLCSGYFACFRDAYILYCSHFKNLVLKNLVKRRENTAGYEGVTYLLTTDAIDKIFS